MNITLTLWVAGHKVRLANDQRAGEPECWKTKIDKGHWSPGESTMTVALQTALDDVLSEILPFDKRVEAVLAERGIRLTASAGN